MMFQGATPFSTPFSMGGSNQIFGRSKLDMSISQSCINEHPLIQSLIAIGNPIVDITVNIDKDTIQKYGLEWGRTVFYNDRNSKFFDELDKKPIVTYTLGGSIQNTLRVCSWCLNMEDNDKGKFKITMLGCVGNDVYKDKIINSLKDSNVEPLLEINNENKTSLCAVGIYKKERCLVPQINASKFLTNEFIKQKEQNIENHDALLIEGYFLQEKYDICKNLCEQFNNENKLVILTLSAVVMVQNHYEKFMEIANKADMIIGNMEEAEVLAGGKGATFQQTFENVHKKLIPKNRTLVVTCGSNGVFCSKFSYTSMRLDLILQSFPNEIKNDLIVDLNGAGDAFLGGFLATYLKGKSLYNCCRVGNDAASHILKNTGCNFNKALKIKMDEQY